MNYFILYVCCYKHALCKICKITNHIVSYTEAKNGMLQVFCKVMFCLQNEKSESAMYVSSATNWTQPRRSPVLHLVEMLFTWGRYRFYFCYQTPSRGLAGTCLPPIGSLSIKQSSLDVVSLFVRTRFNKIRSECFFPYCVH